MKKKSFRLALCLLAFSSSAAFAQTTIELVTTFSYPGAKTNTTPWAINDRGEVAGGIRIRSDSRTFIRHADGTFAPPLVEPNDTAQQTVAQGLNNDRLLCGSYVDGDGYHGFFYDHGSLTEFNIGSATATLVNKLNDAGDFVGGFYADDASDELGFVSSGGTITTFGVPGSVGTEARGINNLGEIVGDYYASGATGSEGFFRDAAGNITPSLHPAGASLTYLFGINDRGGIVGTYFDSKGVHGFFTKLPNTFVSYDYPGAYETYITGINQQGLICGFYRLSTSSNETGFIARVTHAAP